FVPPVRLVLPVLPVRLPSEISNLQSESIIRPLRPIPPPHPSSLANLGTAAYPRLNGHLGRNQNQPGCHHLPTRPTPPVNGPQLFRRQSRSQQSAEALCPVANGRQNHRHHQRSRTQRRRRKTRCNGTSAQSA